MADEGGHRDPHDCARRREPRTSVGEAPRSGLRQTLAGTVTAGQSGATTVPTARSSAPAQGTPLSLADMDHM